MVRVSLAGAVLTFFLAGASLAHADTAPERIGVAAAVRNQVVGVQNQEQRPLSSGSPLFRNELVRTGENGVAQLLFADQTTVSVGPRSELRLDQFVYNPSQNVGQVVFEFTRGAMRFVSGAQDPHSYSVRTPVATIGVRGTIVDFLFVDGKLIAILDEGRALFTLPDGTVLELNEPGESYEFLPGGGVVGPAPWTGRYETGLRVASFPLYGNAYADFPQHEGAPPPRQDDDADLTDELAALRLRFVPEPPSDGGEGSGGGGGEGENCPPEGEGEHHWDHEGWDHHDNGNHYGWDHENNGNHYGWEHGHHHGGEDE